LLIISLVCFLQTLQVIFEDPFEKLEISTQLIHCIANFALEEGQRWIDRQAKLVFCSPTALSIFFSAIIALFRAIPVVSIAF
jgi:hypothetical protein